MIGEWIMNLNIYDVQYDDVIQGWYLTTSVSYQDAIDCFVPLMDKLDFQRNPLRKSFYQRLEHDILSGCIMPNVTLAIRNTDDLPDKQDITDAYVNSKLGNAFILDGIQRLNTMNRIAYDSNFPKDRKLYCNIIICSSMDRLLYRMITLNNGQKPMTARHQIEILASNMFDFDNLPILAVSEKNKSNMKNKDDSMNKDVLIKGYLAYVSGSTNIDNQKIIEDKMNELIAEQIMDSNISEKETEFYDVVRYVDKMIDNDYLREWIRTPNNFIGFCSSMNRSFEIVSQVAVEELSESVVLFEEAFSSLAVSKIKLGMARRKLVDYYFENYSRLSSLSSNMLLNELSQVI